MKITDEAVEAGADKIGGGSTFDREDRLGMAREILEAALPHLSQGAELVGWQSRARQRMEDYIGEWSEWRDGKAPQPVPFYWDVEERPVYALSSAPVGVTPTHRHKKRGSEYVLIGIGKMQTEHWFEDDDTHQRLGPVDMHEVAIYRDVDDGSLWARPREEFEDGRFESLASHEPAPTVTQEGASVTVEARVIAWQGYFPGAGSISSETNLTKSEYRAQQWKEDGATVTALVPLSTLTACQQEVERLRKHLDERLIVERALRRRAETAEARNAELEKALDQLLDDMGENGLCVCQAAKDQAIAALGGQSNEA